ncbi:MAG: glutaminyl-peptide cyclotransferase, partial [Anaerolineae bacterium]|nr:glutaminyl-peptide cyclotransferase [Anaerolineae bacterium]
MKHRVRRHFGLGRVDICVQNHLAHRRKCQHYLVALLLLALTLASGAVSAQDDNPIYNEVGLLAPEVVSVIPHDTTAYTQGLLLLDGKLYESVGEAGSAALREIDLATGDVLRSVALPDQAEAGGLARLDGQIVLLTGLESVALTHDPETLETTGELEVSGWGICTDDALIYSSRGTPFIDMRDQQSLDLIFSGLITVQGSLVDKISELECVGDYIYATIMRTN